MAAVAAGEDELRPLLPSSVALAASRLAVAAAPIKIVRMDCLPNVFLKPFGFEFTLWRTYLREALGETPTRRLSRRWVRERPARWISSLRSAFQRFVRGQGGQLLLGLDATQPVSTEGVELTGKALGKTGG